jgi:hypothetical protein
VRIAAVALLLPLIASGPVRSDDVLAKVTRAEMIALAKAMAGHGWTCKAKNLKAACATKYKSRFKESQAVIGVAYDWGGMDDIASFAKKLENGQAAGSHKDEGVSPCTTGVDCSGLLSLCWRQPGKFGTSNIGKIADALPNIDKLKDLKPGDALNRPGSHIVMFAGYRPDGGPLIYEASGQASRVVFNDKDTWTRFDKYAVIRYKGTVD